MAAVFRTMLLKNTKAAAGWVAGCVNQHQGQRLAGMRLDVVKMVFSLSSVFQGTF